MHRHDETKKNGENLQRLIVQLALAHEKAIRRIDGSELKENLNKLIDGIIQSVRQELRPRYGENIILYEKGRSIRSFQVELHRLWTRAISLYLEVLKSAFTPEIDQLLRDPENEVVFNDYKALVIEHVQTCIVPILKELETPGEDFYLHTYDLMLSADQGAIIKCIADTGKTPSQLDAAFFGMFGLLIQAESSENDGDISRAYSFLLDANHLIGMHEGARFALKHFDAIAVKRRAKVNSRKSRTKTDKIKVRALELFYSLRPTDEAGNPHMWNSANEAMETVWAALEEEARAQGKEKLDISDRTILSLCQDLHRRDKEGCALDIRVEVMQFMPDGTKIKIPLA